MSPVAINGVDKQGVGINGVQVKQALSAANETVNKGVFEATTLSAVDADLAVANIKSGVTIFGVLGTLSLSQDITGSAVSNYISTASTGYIYSVSIAASGELDLSSTSNSFSANSMQVGVASCVGWEGTGNSLKLRLYMNGVSVAESGFLGATGGVLVAVGTSAMAGVKICKATLHNYDAVSSRVFYTGPNSGQGNAPCGGGIIGVGSIKVT